MRNMEKMVESVAPRGRFWDPEFFVSTRAARDVQVCANPSGFVVLPGTVNPVYYSSVMSCCSLADPGGAPPQASRFFGFYIPIFRKVATTDLGAPFEKSWIRHCCYCSSDTFSVVKRFRGQCLYGIIILCET